MYFMKYAMIILILACIPGQAQEAKTLYIADHLVDCIGVAPQKCMLVRESPDEPWGNFYGRIEGFEYQEGFNYEVRVEVFRIDNPPADASSIRYVLKEVVSKLPSDDAEMSSGQLSGTWKVIRITGLDTLSTSPTFNFIPEEKRVAGSAGCNNYFASYEQTGKELRLGAAGLTRMACPDMTAEGAFVKKLEEIAYFKRIKRELHLFDAKDNLLMIAVAE